jgi:hypothetical protein
MTYAGREALEWFMQQEAEVVVGTAILLAAVIAVRIWWRRRAHGPALADAE